MFTKISDTEFKEVREIDIVYNLNILLERKKMLEAELIGVNSLLSEAEKVSVKKVTI